MTFTVIVGREVLAAAATSPPTASPSVAPGATEAQSGVRTGFSPWLPSRLRLFFNSALEMPDFLL